MEADEEIAISALLFASSHVLHARPFDSWNEPVVTHVLMLRDEGVQRLARWRIYSTTRSGMLDPELAR